LVLNADELANLVVVPSSEDLNVEGSRGARAEQQSRNPLPRPDHDITRQLRTPGLELGHLLDENREPEDEPLRLSSDLLPFHVGRFAKTGAGKSIALINDALSLYEQTSGPVFLIDTKGGGLPEHYMRAHAKRFGFDDLEEHVIHFDIPERLPGFAFFNIEPALANGVPRMQAIKDRVDHYVEVLKMTMGEDRYEQAVVSPNLLKYLIRLMYDEEHGLDHGRYRESVHYFGQSQLEQVVDQLYEAGPPQSAPEEAPQSSSEEVTSKIHRHLTADPRTFANIMGGVSNRMDYITADPFLKQIFDTTEHRFDMRDVLDEDVVVIFDLGDLRSEAAKVMAGVILTNLYDAVTEREPSELAATSDDYVANLLIDEASSIVVSEVLNDLLEQGREFKLSVELVSQFPEQMELEGDREVYLNVLNNIGSPIVGKIAVDDEIARALAHEDMDPVEFRNRVRALPRGEWIAQVPSPAFGETGPMPFSVDPLPIPEGHPESDDPLAADEDERFGQALEIVHERTQAEYGVPVDAGEPTVNVPTSIQDTLELVTDGLDELLAVMVRYVQLREGVRETNMPVPVKAVDDLLESWYDAELPDVHQDPDGNAEDRDVPSRETLAEIRGRSPLFELVLDTERDETLMRLTETGERTSEAETGEVQAAGGDAHDDAVSQVEAKFTRAGFLVAPVRQDGSGQPDAWAVHPDIEVPLALEIESTTHTKPAKVIRNLGRAQANGAVPVFVVPSGTDDCTIARRVENILTDPVKDRTRGAVEFYMGTDHVTFNGGAEADNGVTAVRPVASGADAGSNRTRWRRVGEEFVLVDETGTEHARVADVDEAPKEQFPAVYSKDLDAGTVTVTVPGELPRSYESEAAFREDWVPIKRPVIPDVDLPVPEYGRETYAIVVLLEGDGEDTEGSAEIAIYDDGELVSFDRLEDDLQKETLRPVSSSTDAVGSPEPPAPVTADGGEAERDSPSEADDSQANSTQGTAAPSADGEEVGVESFVSERIVEAEENVVPFREVYEAYESFVAERSFEPKAATHLTPALKEHVPIESKPKWHDGETQQCYVGIELVDDGYSSGGGSDR
jgi:DNA helicase HerA-like ATPase